VEVTEQMASWMMEAWKVDPEVMRYQMLRLVEYQMPRRTVERQMLKTFVEYQMLKRIAEYQMLKKFVEHQMVQDFQID
jgi:hypothetical protein